ncbi:MAG: hypothetical protein ACD_58C00103G0004 [uncultured bacterium]|nr:MAG: hypothetical protein ACD_58C00103G0004 [uncultured bacterium]
MLDIKFIRENKKEVEKAIKNKNVNLDLGRLLLLDKEKQDLQQKIEKLRSERNCLAKSRTEVIKAKKVKEFLRDLEPRFTEVSEELLEIMLHVPNIYSDDTPIGKDEKENKVIYSWGKLKKFSFKIKDHIELAKDLDLIDLERGTKVSGFRGYYLKNQAVKLQLALMQYTLDKLSAEGFTPMITPTLVHKMALVGSGHFPEAKDEIYQIANPGKLSSGEAIKEETYLVGTAEPSLLAYRANEVLDESELPLKFSGFSQCYRSEIGSYGKDLKGVFRIHEFMKVEQVVICKADYKEAEKMFSKLLAISQSILKDLELPYQVVQMCTGDMGLGKYKMCDVETWMPANNAYRETHSCSNLTDWQMRRLSIRYKTKDGQKLYPFALNNTGIASPRILIALLENHQQEDGSIKIPKGLQKYTNFNKIQK